MNTLLLRLLCFFFLYSCLSASVHAQWAIEWQKSFGTPYSDYGRSFFSDEQGNLVIVGLELHPDFTGNLRPYLLVTKLDPDGEEIWKTYHDIAFETFNPPVEYSVGSHFYTEEWGDTLLNLQIHINNRDLLYKILDRTGTYYTYEEIPAQMVDVDRENEKVYAYARCSVVQACYGPDSLVVEKFDPTPDSIIFNPVVWTYQLKQNIRTAPIQGHYDFDVEDIREDANGNVYLLVQIERWDFQFCTDCADAFVDAWCEVFRLSPQGALLGHKRIAITKAVVSQMGFVALDATGMTIRIDDINPQGTAVVTSIYHVDPSLDQVSHYTLDRQYSYVREDAGHALWACTHVFDPNDPNIKGATDILVASFDSEGGLKSKAYYGGSVYEFPTGFVLTTDGDPVFMANTSSSDFDVASNHGDQDIWVVKLTENTSAVRDPDSVGALSLWPNPCVSAISLDPAAGFRQLNLWDTYGNRVAVKESVQAGESVDVQALPAGMYILRATDSSGRTFIGRFIKG